MYGPWQRQAGPVRVVVGRYMAGSPNGGSRPYFGTARTIAGLVLVVVAAILAILDAFLPDYSVDSIQLGLILGTGLLFLGVEAGRKLLG